MAILNKTKTVFAFTSPRTIEKIVPEIEVLIESFNGEPWNENSQVAFFRKLFQTEFYEGNKMPNNMALAARDRITRAPKALGFVDLKPKIQLTEVGALLLSGKRSDEIIMKQLFKFQLPSPFHTVPPDRDFNVRPYLELLRLTNDIGNLSKNEIAIFFVQMTNYRDFDRVRDSIQAFRREIKSHIGNRKAFIEKKFEQEIRKVYVDEIQTNSLKTRESGDESITKFIKTKRSNQLDYADAFIRYLRATKLITFDKKTFRMIISPSRQDEVNFILKKVQRQAISYSTEAEYKKYLFSSKSLMLLRDNRTYLKKKLNKLSVKFDGKITIDEMKDLLESTELNLIVESIQKTENSLKDYNDYDDVVDIFDKIIKKEIPDPPLFLEWNIWRSLVMINYCKHAIGNFSIDLDGVPLNTAMGNMPDILIEYEGFKVMVEVTMSSGNKQYEMEGEPVARHFGKIQNETSDPVYCLFIAPKISDGALAHFFNLNRFNTKAYGGKTRIIPMSLEHFIKFISIAKEKKFADHNVLKNYLNSLIEKIPHAEDEAVWFQNIQQSISTWVTIN